ncbi:MAG: 4Fe-4S binding protein [Planctomycetes bacterium]|nr:4Fe-4S binding protein [Planctomycetota bacterium]MCG2684077.1 4Fe-4S binding protein [Planctomycetales bacterium]
MDLQRSRRVIEINERIVGPPPPRPKTVRPRKASDFPHVPASYLDVARRLSSPLMMGPPLCDELIAFVSHAFTEEEAGAARHLGLISGRRAMDIARAEHRPLDQIEPILLRLVNEKRLLIASGPAENQRYRLLPIVPGMFENVLIGQSPDSLSGWHNRFIELFETLYETGYSLDYCGHPTPPVRYLPVGKSIEAQPMALPTDKLEDMLDGFDTFGVGNCQCRMAMEALGRGCGKPLGNCTAMGQWAETGIEAGVLRRVSKKEILEIKHEAEAHGLVNWMMNVRSTLSQCSCSCCGCCCHAMRTVNEFSAPGLIAPPHFVPRLNPDKCVHCGRCAESCPMGAIVVELGGKGDRSNLPERPSGCFAQIGPVPFSLSYRHMAERCIGCGLCVLACDQQRALTMTPAAGYRPPYRNWFSLIAHSIPGLLLTSWKLRRR